MSSTREDGSQKIVIRQWVRLSHEEAMNYWAKMGDDVDDWGNRLPEPAVDRLAEWVSFAVSPEGTSVSMLGIWLVMAS